MRLTSRLDGGLPGAATGQKARPAQESSLGPGSPWQLPVLLELSTAGGCWSSWPSKLSGGGIVLRSARSSKERGSL